MKTKYFMLLLLAFVQQNLFGQVGPIGSGGGHQIQVGTTTPHGPFTPINVDLNPTDNPEDPEELRLIYWMHGLSGNSSAWSDAAFASQHGAPGFPARNVMSITDTEYKEDQSMEGAALEADQKLSLYKHLGGKPERNMAIAHSQGGIVTRAMAYIDHCKPDPTPPNFGGFVTFGTPHQGARILNNAPMFDELIGDMCSELSAGPVKEFLDGWSQFEFKIAGISFNVNLKLYDLLGDMLVSTLCSNIADNFAPLLRAHVVTEITNDYMVGSPFLEEMNDCESEDFRNMPKMAFYGIEPTEGLLPRTMQWLMVNPNTENYFSANDDNGLIEMWNENFFRYADRVAQYQDRYDMASAFYHGGKCYTLVRYYTSFCKMWRRSMREIKTMIREWQRGVDFLNSMDDRYKIVMGALEINQRTIHECWVCDCGSKGRGRSPKATWKFSHRITPTSPPCQKTGPGDTKQYEMRPTTIVERIEHPSDGVVLAESASNLPDASHPPQLCDNSSHMQMRNDRNTKTHLLRLYDGGYLSFFRTKKI